MSDSALERESIDAAPALPLRLNLGCGDDILPGFVNHDMSAHRSDIDVAHDLREFPWPWPDHCADQIRLIDVLEHLQDTVAVINECWRVLRPGGLLGLRSPHYEHENAWLDPTHVRPFHLNSFDYFDPATYRGRHFGFYTDRKWRIERKELKDGNVLIEMRTRPRGDTDIGPPHGEEVDEEVADLVFKLEELIPQEAAFLVVDGKNWTGLELSQGQRAIPFLERNGEYWGKPENDVVAIRELERLRSEGAAFLLLPRSTFWWLDHYSILAAYVHLAFPCTVDDHLLKMFDLGA
jgi:SAM-dependent methyltransferase